MAATLGTVMLLAPSAPLLASSHREAPFITKNPKVDGTDFYLFRSYEKDRQDYVTLIANYLPLQDAYGGPNYFNLDDQALYEIHIDNTGDGKEDLTFQFKFQTTLAGGDGAKLEVGPDKVKVAVPLINIGAVTAADTASQNRLETYSVNLVTGDRRTGTSTPIKNAVDGSTVFKKPLDYIGTKSLGNAAAYSAYAATHIYSVTIPGCTPPAKLFVGQRKESFAVNLGTIFDLINAPPGVITGGNTADGRKLAPSTIDSKNVTSLSLEVPASCLKGAGKVIGGWTTASVRQARVINPSASFTLPAREGGPWTQVSRLGSPLVNEVVIGIKDKDKWNSSSPKDDAANFADYVLTPTLPELIEILFMGAGVVAPNKFPRTDLVAAFLTGVTGVNATTPALAEMLRLNLVDFAPTPKGSQSDLGAAACFVQGVLTPANPGCDPNGFPNGRRPGDDTVDIALRVVMGYLLPLADAPSGQLGFTDAVLQSSSQFDDTFPYLTTPLPGAS